MLHILFFIGVANVIATAVKTALDRYAPTSKADTVLGAILKGLNIAVSFLTANTPGAPKQVG